MKSKKTMSCNLGRTIHFVGIGGIGMSAIAHILLEKGETVTGSDIKGNPVIERLRRKGALVYIGHRKENVRGARLLVVSSAISKSNPELREARRCKIPIIPRAAMLASLMEFSKNIIIAGTHGKTTTTSMISFLLETIGFDPTLAIGGELRMFGGNAKLGRGEYFVAEADESDGSFLGLNPDIAIVTNIEPEHLENYRNIDEIRDAFRNFLENIKPSGATVLCVDDENVSRIIRQGLAPDVQIITYGIKDKKAELRARNLQLKPWGSKSSIFRNGIFLGTLQLNVPGIHNVLNALATIGTGLRLGIRFEKISNAVEKFKNVRRRLEIKGESGGILVLDDYAHHPTEVRMTLKSVRGLHRKRIVVIFQPHRWTRTKFLGRELGIEISKADTIFVIPVYSAGEKPIPNIHPDIILNAIRPLNRNVKFLKESGEVVSVLLKTLKKGDVLVTLGAGDVYKIGEELLKKLKRRAKCNKDESEDKKEN